MRIFANRYYALALFVFFLLLISSNVFAEWQINALYTFSKIVENDEMVDTDSAYFKRVETGNKELVDGKNKFAYQILNLRNTDISDPSDVIIEIEYDNDSLFCWPPGFSEDFSGDSLCPPDLVIKQVSLDFGAERMGAHFLYTENQIKFFENLEISPTIATLTIDGSKDSFCSRDKYTIRFKISELPTSYNDVTKSFEQAVYAIGIREDQQAHFAITNLSVLGSDAGITIEDCPIDSPGTNCVAYNAGTIERTVIMDDTMHFVAVPEGKTYGEIVGFWVAEHLPPQFTVVQSTVQAIVEFTNGTTIPLPDDCEFVAVQNELGNQWAKLRIKFTGKRYNPLGQLIETKVVNEVVARWDWTVVAKKSLLVATHQDVPSIYAVAPNTLPVTVSAGDSVVIRLRRGQVLNIDYDIFLNEDGTMRFIDTTSFSSELFCKIFPSLGICDLPRVELTQEAWVFVSGNLVFGENVDVNIHLGSGIAMSGPNANVSGVNIVQGDFDGNGCVDRDGDLKLILMEIRGVHSPTERHLRFDLNGDRVVNIADARYLVTLFTYPDGLACP